MSDEIKNKFRDFEGEASDEHIGQRWEAIRPYLPKENQPAGLLFPKFRGRGLVLAAALVACLSTTAYFLLRDDRSTTARVSTVIVPSSAEKKIEARHIKKDQRSDGKPSLSNNTPDGNGVSQKENLAAATEKSAQADVKLKKTER